MRPCRPCLQQSHPCLPVLPSPSRSSYVPEPKTLLHYASAEAKQLWTVGVLLVMARASPPVRLAIAALLVAATMAVLPARLWRPQLARLSGLCAVLFFFTLIGVWACGDGVQTSVLRQMLWQPAPTRNMRGRHALAAAA